MVSCGNTPTISSEDRINTSVAQTVAAAQPSGVQLPTQGVAAPSTPAPAPVEQATLTPMPLPTLAPPTATFTASPTVDACNQAKWIQDVTIPDGTRISPSATFTKTWRIQNTGTCTWNTGYAVVFDSGHSSGAPAATQFPSNVPPGGTIDVSVIIAAPAANGDYTWRFMLRSDTGRVFGFGTGYAYPMTAVIKVEPISLLPLAPGNVQIIPLEDMKYDFATNYCSAAWASIFGPLDCPGDMTDSQGFVKRDDDPKLQDGKAYSGKAIFTHPAFDNDGVIRGNFPAIAIANGYRFRATIGCTYNKENCNVRFTVSYKAGGDPWEQLGTWVVDYNDEPVKLDIDLSFLDGKNVAFGLVVAANGSEEQDWAHWVKPRIIK
jgi:hypothetical protein